MKRRSAPAAAADSALAREGAELRLDGLRSHAATSA